MAEPYDGEQAAEEGRTLSRSPEIINKNQFFALARPCREERFTCRRPRSARLFSRAENTFAKFR
jgi:hypothetical protein